MNMRWTPPAANDVRLQGGPAMVLLTGALLAAALVFGGASRENVVQVTLLELFSLVVLALAVWRLTLNGWGGALAPAGILAAVMAIPLLQLVPLPFGLWAALPGREAAADALQLAGLGSGWRPYSLAPLETWRHALALLPPAAVFLGACALREGEQRNLTVVVIVGAVLSLLVGLAQIAGGADSAFYFYDTTNRGSAVGLFSNRNHQAALLVAALPLAALWFGLGRKDPRRALIGVAIVLTVFLIEIVALIVVRSRAGVLLMVPSLIAGLLLVWRAGGGRASRRSLLVLGGVIVVALGAGLAFGAGPVMERFADSEDRRLTTAPVIAEAALAYLPFGAGVGSFPQVYAGVEPVETMNQTFFNHAHNDYLEVLLDTGIAGVAVLLAFLLWWGSRSWAAWRGGDALACAGSAATGLLLVHSAADYPLRTLAMACVFALGCALMVARKRAR